VSRETHPGAFFAGLDRQIGALFAATISLEDGVLGGKGNGFTKSVRRTAHTRRGFGDFPDGAIRRYRAVLHTKMFSHKLGELCPLIFRFRCSQICRQHLPLKTLSSRARPKDAEGSQPILNRTLIHRRQLATLTLNKLQFV
jgi:hypothetical protein